MEKLKSIKRILSEMFDISEDDLDSNTRFIDLPEWDSLKAIAFLAYCESYFETELPMSLLVKVQTIGELADAISK